MPDDEGLREELAEDLRDAMPGTAPELAHCLSSAGWLHLVDAALPRIERHAARRAAEALREAADYSVATVRINPAWLRARADALAADGTEPP